MMFGVMIQGLYIIYFTVVRGMLSVWVCSTKDNGASALVADPALSCDVVPAALATLRKWSIASAVLYTVGIPAAFAFILFRYRHEIREDQVLLSQGIGASAATNPHFSVRRRFHQLYDTFAPDFAHWRLVLLLRKFAIVSVAVTWVSFPMVSVRIFLGDNVVPCSFSKFSWPLLSLLFGLLCKCFCRSVLVRALLLVLLRLCLIVMLCVRLPPQLQASMSVAIIFISYALQVRYRPFLEGDNASQLDLLKISQSGAVNVFFLPFNRMEAGYLITSMVTLLAGMIFQSGSLTVSSGGYLALTVLVGLGLVGSVALFLGLIALEVVRSVRYSSRVKSLLQSAQRRRSGRLFILCAWSSILQSCEPQTAVLFCSLFSRHCTTPRAQQPAAKREQQ